jgi:predicted lipoprotein with Yx(FWY)xxD motif
MTALRTSSALVALAAAFAVGLVACGGGSDSSSAAAGSGETVSVADVGGVGAVLVDSHGDALYSPDQEAGGTVLCTDACASVWVPLTLSSGSEPSGPPQVSGKLGIVTRPDGSRQVTYAGKPLYTFVEDSGPRTVRGDDASDSFGGTSFTWHVVATGPLSSGGTTSPGGGYGY